MSKGFIKKKLFALLGKTDYFRVNISYIDEHQLSIKISKEIN